MKTSITFFFLILVTSSFSQYEQNFWKSELNFDNGIVFSTFLNIEKTNNQVTITSPKNADVRMFGNFKAKLGRIMGKMPKKGIILRINAYQKGDSLYGNTKIPMFGLLKFKGILTENSFNGDLIKNDTLTIGILKGVKTNENSIDYSHLYPKILEITNDNIYSKIVLQSKEWNKFQKKLKKLCVNAQDDIELYLGFNILAPKLPFSHYNLLVQEEVEEDNQTEELKNIVPTIIFDVKNKNTAYLKIKNFSTSQKELAVTLPKIVEKNYQNLIVDLRDNGGGGIDAAFEFAKYITDKDIEVGYFVTNKLVYSGFQPELFKTLPELQPKSTEEFGNDLKTGKGSKLIFKKPDNPVFSGNLYVLTNVRTGSTCEPLVYVLKNRNMATIIGEKTAGAMLASSYFNFSEKYILKLPIADFYTYDGDRLEGVGVMPNIETASEDALNKALEIINSNVKKE